MECEFESSPALRYSDPDTAPVIPLFRCTDLAAAESRAARARAQLIARQPQAAWTDLLFRDPDGHLVGFRESAAESALACDIEARRRAPFHSSAESFNPGCAPLPQGLQSLDWIRRRVSRVEPLEAFYADVVGLRRIGRVGTSALLDLGDNSTLELALGGQTTTPPEDRTYVPCAFILRVMEFDSFLSAMRDRGAPMVGSRIQFGRGALAYFADPDGQIFGVEERYEQAACPPGTEPFSEDLEANRRWRANRIW